MASALSLNASQDLSYPKCQCLQPDLAAGGLVTLRDVLLPLDLHPGIYGLLTAEGGAGLSACRSCDRCLGRDRVPIGGPSRLQVDYGHFAALPRSRPLFADLTAAQRDLPGKYSADADHHCDRDGS